MKKIAIAVALLASLVVAPAFAADICTVQAGTAQPKAALQAQLEKDGWTVRQIKDNQGCYEAYAMKTDGSRMENLFNPQTLVMLDVAAD